MNEANYAARPVKRKSLLALCAVTILAVSQVWAQELWPDLSRPAPLVGGGEHDAGVVVGIESYGFVPPVPGAEANAKAWYDYLTRTRGATPANVKLLLGVDATREEMLEAVQSAAGKTGPRGSLWFIFVGHGVPSFDGKDGLLVGVDAQQKAASLQKRSLRRGELLAALNKSRAGTISVVLDACFSGRGPDGASIAPGLQPLVTVATPGRADSRMVVLTAAKGDQVAGALPGANRPAFSYLTLGALRGWAGDEDRRVTAGAVWRYATEALEATLRGRNQTPDIIGKEGMVLGASAGEKGPDLVTLAKATAGNGGPDFQVSKLPPVPRAQAPKTLNFETLGLDFGNARVNALELYEAAIKFDKSEASPEDKAESWRKLSREIPQFRDLGQKRADEWDRYAVPRKAAEDARRRRVEARDLDWVKLSRLLALEVVPKIDKRRWSVQFAEAYLESPGIKPDAAEGLVQYMPESPAKETLVSIARKAVGTGQDGSILLTPQMATGKTGIQWLWIPGNSFLMGSESWNSGRGPLHRVMVKSFYMAKTEVTNKQYRACVEANACSPPIRYEGGDDHPVVNVNWRQANDFAAWVGGRLPSEAEWEYAARNAGKELMYPWGNEHPTCRRAVMSRLIDQHGRYCEVDGTQPVCSRHAGNTEQGLCDMAGNVMEWVQDRFHSSYVGAPSDGSAWETPSNGDAVERIMGQSRVVRSSSIYDDVDAARVVYRSRRSPGSSNEFLGFRPVR